MRTFSGLTHLVSELKDNLPRSSRALIAWQMLDNPAEGGPVPEAALSLIIEAMARRRRWLEIVIVLLRESGWEALVGEDVSWVAQASGPPRVALVRGSGAWGLPRRRGPTKE